MHFVASFSHVLLILYKQANLRRMLRQTRETQLIVLEVHHVPSGEGSPIYARRPKEQLRIGKHHSQAMPQRPANPGKLFLVKHVIG